MSPRTAEGHMARLMSAKLIRHTLRLPKMTGCHFTCCLGITCRLALPYFCGYCWARLLPWTLQITVRHLPGSQSKYTSPLLSLYQPSACLVSAWS